MKKVHRLFFVGLTAALTLILTLVAAAGETQHTTPSTLTKPAGIDLDVTYISRAPLYNRYIVKYTYDNRPYLLPGTEDDQRWPAQGEIVTFTAHVMNKGTVASGAFDFAWSIDGSVVATGTQPSLAPGAEVTATYLWAWDHTVVDERLVGEHTVAFEADPADVINETYETNNLIEDYTNALSLKLALTPALYDALEIPIDPQWPYSAEDWLQKQIAAMNAAFERSVYPSAPQGIEERVRLDQIVITGSEPDLDPYVDGQYFMTGDDRHGNSYYHDDTDVSGALIHELTHQLGIIDLYNFDVSLEVPQVRDGDDHPVQMEYWLQIPGIMDNPGIDPPSYSEHTTLALNANKGYRRGYYGEYLYDVPPTVTLYLLNNNITSASDVTVRFFKRTSHPNILGSQHGVIDNVPEITVTTGVTGMVVLPNRDVGDPVSTRTGHTLENNPFGLIDIVGKNDEFLVEIATDNHREYQWLDLTTLNLMAWHDRDVLLLTTRVPLPTAPAPPAPLTGMQAYGEVTLSWTPSPSPTVTAYHVYRTSGPAYEWRRVVTGTTALSVTLPYPYEQGAAGYAVTALNDSGRESGFGDIFWALRLHYPSDLVVGADGKQRIVLNPQNDYALLLQSPEGNYLDTLGSYDLHLENTRYLARDPLGRLLVPHPGDDYSARHSVRILDGEANLLYEFGQYGAGAGEFDWPAGVVAWNVPTADPADWATGRILVADSNNHRIQAFNFSGSFISVYGTQGTSLGEFDYPQGLTTLPTGEVVVVDHGNNRLQVLDFDGETFTATGEITADFSTIFDLDAYGSDRLIVADSGHNAVKVLNTDGDLLATYDAPDAAYGGTFNMPHSVAVDSFGRILVADTGNRRIAAISGALPHLPPSSLKLEGPVIGQDAVPYTFTATISPTDATLPLTYTWQASEHSPVINTVAAYSDTVTFSWGLSGTKRITVTVANDGGTLMETHGLLINPTCGLYLPLVMRNHSRGPVIHYFRSDVEVADPGQTIHLEWASSGATDGSLYNLLPSGQYGSFWDVAPNGTFDYTIPESRRNWDGFVLFVNDDEGHYVSDGVYITLTCPDEWFFTPAPDICPAGPAVYSGGAEQRFEHGRMLWVESEDRIYVLYDDDQIPDWQAFTDEWDEGEPEDGSEDPPPGYYEPVRGFGLVWREQPNVRDRLGWGTTPEQGYTTAFQRSSEWRYPHTYIKAYDGGTWHLEPEGSGWEHIP
ncbi:MAG: CARDB domain-containing protein [Anaerolineae bacterium]